MVLASSAARVTKRSKNDFIMSHAPKNNNNNRFGLLLFAAVCCWSLSLALLRMKKRKTGREGEREGERERVAFLVQIRG